MLRPKVLVVTGDGINCENETRLAFETVGAEVRIRHVNEILSDKSILSAYQILALPGGFSYGDDLGSGKVMALKLKYSLQDELNSFIEKQKLIIGICNGFQILLQLGILPFENEEQHFALAPNASTTFQNEWVAMHVDKNNKNIWLQGLEEKEFLLPIRHGEGRIVVNNKLSLHHAVDHGLAALKYKEDVNGSELSIAGLCNQAGTVFGLMPHPECAVFEQQLPEKSGNTVGKQIFANAVHYFL